MPDEKKPDDTPREFPVSVTVGRTKVEVILILKAGTEVAVKETKITTEPPPSEPDPAAIDRAHRLHSASERVCC
jgi:hypothetical protein